MRPNPNHVDLEGKIKFFCQSILIIYIYKQIPGVILTKYGLVILMAINCQLKDLSFLIVSSSALLAVNAFGLIQTDYNVTNSFKYH